MTNTLINPQHQECTCQASYLDGNCRTGCEGRGGEKCACMHACRSTHPCRNCDMWQIYITWCIRTWSMQKERGGGKFGWVPHWLDRVVLLCLWAVCLNQGNVSNHLGARLSSWQNRAMIISGEGKIWRKVIKSLWVTKSPPIFSCYSLMMIKEGKYNQSRIE